MVTNCWAAGRRVVGQVLVAKREVIAPVVPCVVQWVKFCQHAASVRAHSSNLIFHHCLRGASVPVAEAFAPVMRHLVKDTVQ